MLPYLTNHFGNPSSTHRYGVEARYAVEKARRRIAKLLSLPNPDWAIFTSGATEANNLYLRGIVELRRRGGVACHLLSAATEHKAVLDPLKEAANAPGVELTLVTPDSEGRVTSSELVDHLRAETALVSLMLANNEIGTIQAVPEIAAAVRERSAAMIHCDAVQAAGKLPLHFPSLGVDAITLSAHKFHGPKGIGLLVCDPDKALAPLLSGGGQERNLRAGTENVAGIVGMAKALELAIEELEELNTRLVPLRERLWASIASHCPGAVRNSPSEGSLPELLNVSLPGFEGSRLVQALDERGFAVSAGSACASSQSTGSHVVLAISGGDEARTRGALRIGLGRDTGWAQIEGFAPALAGILAERDS